MQGLLRRNRQGMIDIAPDEEHALAPVVVDVDTVGRFIESEVRVPQAGDAKPAIAEAAHRDETVALSPIIERLEPEAVGDVRLYAPGRDLVRDERKVLDVD